MLRTLVCCIPLLLVSVRAGSEEPAPKGDKLLEGMSIVGNHETPKSLVIVPWKSSELGDTLGVTRALDDGRRAVDRDVFLRELDYYRIREESSGARPSAQ